MNIKLAYMRLFPVGLVGATNCRSGVPSVNGPRKPARRAARWIS
jgi:hypothetical protein